MNPITLDNLETFSVAFEDSGSYKWFEEMEGKGTLIEHQDQITILNKEASNFLWNYDMKVNNKELYDYENLDRYFKQVETTNVFSYDEVKKWLFNRGVPFKRKVFLSIQPNEGYILTWKMIVKYSNNIFHAHDLAIWDKSLNWLLIYYHDNVWYFGKNRIKK